jgi:3-methyl-2-oxobutanoate hydroxymethyltransferase
MVMSRISVNDLSSFKQSKKRFTVLTSYDSLTASLFDESGIPVLLVGDSAANLVFGYASTVPLLLKKCCRSLKQLPDQQKKQWL